MSKENISSGRREFNHRLRASTPVFNLDPLRRFESGVYLKVLFPKNKQCEVYRITEREFQVLHKIIDGLSNKEIAKELRISPYSARNHIKHILYSFDCHKGRGENVRTVLIAQLVSEGVLSFKPRISEEEWVGLRR
jgi:DNA-binding NarL/FixJ family response regulator